jgi:hypothetical protein
MYVQVRQTDPRNPNPWLALALDDSLPMHPPAKAALLANQDNWSRRLLLPIVRPFARLSIVLIQLLRMVIPESWASSSALHHTIHLGLKHFVRKEANYLILRHFNIGTEILQFIADNAGVEINSTQPLRPRHIDDLKQDVFLIHDLNIYNFIIELNERLSAEGRGLTKPEKVDYRAITDDEFGFAAIDEGRFNVIDLQTAIEAYTPMYALLLSDKDFWRASNSLQLDETMAIYISRILGDSMALALVNNRHPTVPIITLQAGFRLMLHGLDAEILHGYLRQRKREETGLS